MKPFFVVLARDKKKVDDKIKELQKLEMDYVIVCGERLPYKKTLFRPSLGKYDAINFVTHKLPHDEKIIAFNDVDTKIYNIESALQDFMQTGASLLFTKLQVNQGPQVFLNTLLDSVKRKILVTASGELMLIKRDVLNKIVPLKPCKAEDTYMMFKVLESGGKIAFCEKCLVETKRTVTFQSEEEYKRRTVAGTYQALSYTNPPFRIKVFYYFLPFLSPLLIILGRKGYYAMKGILLGFVDFIRGDKEGYWKSICGDK